MGLKSVPAREAWRSYRSLTEPEGRQAFIKTIRSVIDPGGQSVQALDRLYLTEGLPTLIVWGEKDRMIPVSHAYRALEAAPHSRLEIMPGVGHFPQSEDPAGFVTILQDFLHTSEPSAASADDR
jgi:pimeloyl-ACP methyl ester carboxylesterase